MRDLARNVLSISRKFDARFMRDLCEIYVRFMRDVPESTVGSIPKKKEVATKKIKVLKYNQRFLGRVREVVPQRNMT
jgi:hypothetical protein